MKRRLVEPKTVAEVLDVDVQTVRRWCRNGYCEAKRTPGGRAWRVVLETDAHGNENVVLS